MRIYLIISTVLCFGLSLAEAKNNSQKCGQYGQYTKSEPSAEKDMNACKNYACNSCCTSQFMQELALVPLQMVGATNFSQCGGLSHACSQYMSNLQCFYHCSPNLYPWLDEKGRLHNMPMCSSFCEEWYAACANDQTCVDGPNWIEGFKTVMEGTKYTFKCKVGQPCRNFSEVYHNSPREFCDTIYRKEILYTENGNACMNPGNLTGNELSFKHVAGSEANFTICESEKTGLPPLVTSAIIGIVGALTLVIICGLIVFFCRRKKSEEPESGTRREMEVLNTEPAPVLE